MKLNHYPFDYDHKQPFIQQASDWIADVFYEKLPESGFEVRDEQIYMAFQLERAYADREIIFAEAGVGTGKTLAYLLYAISYARYSGKPAIIACADESLIEQLVKEEGDLAKIAKYLDFQIDARLAKSKDQYLCLEKLDEARGEEENELFADRLFDIYEGLPDFVTKPTTMQSFYPYGDRRDYPDLSDKEWSRIGWDVFQDCFVCDRRHRCGQTLSRDYYRKTADAIICSHDFYMQHVWTFESRKREGQLPLLPEHSSVVFDEGHLLETAAQKALTYKLNHDVFEEIVVRLLQGEIRESLALAIEEAISASERLFQQLEQSSRQVEASDRMEILWSDRLTKELHQFHAAINEIEEQLVYEGGMFTIDSYQLKIVEEHLDTIQQALSQFRQPVQPISWASKDKLGLSLIIMPKKVKEMLKEYVFNGTMPIVFSSATLSVNGDFKLLADALGIGSHLSFTVQSPYDYNVQMKLSIMKQPAISLAEKSRKTIELIEKNGGSTLVLFSSQQQLEVFRQYCYSNAELSGMLFEGTQEISHLIKQFQMDKSSVLCASTLWEGLDIPGPALTQVIIWDLPFPPNDPVFTALRAEAKQSFEQIDMPYMLLRLRQGIGRLIRAREDAGQIVLLSEQLMDDAMLNKIIQIMPVSRYSLC